MTNLSKKHQLSFVFMMFDILISRSPTEATTRYLRKEYDELCADAGMLPKQDVVSLTAFEDISE